MATRDRACALLAMALGAACSVGNLSYAEVARDFDALVRWEPSADPARPDEPQRLVYADRAELAPWYARATLLLPFKPLLVGVFGEVSATELENSPQMVRELVTVLPPKAGDDPLRGAATVHRLVPMVELDASALNRILALEGLAAIAHAQGIVLTDGLDRDEAQPALPADMERLLGDFASLRPALREGPLSSAAAVRYREALGGLSARPLPTWEKRLDLVMDLRTALQQETDAALSPEVLAALRGALGHSIRWTVVRALQGQDKRWIDVRLRALEILHRDAGPGGVPLLLALMASSPEQIAAGQKRFDQLDVMQLRLIHLCGQLDRERASRSIRLPGRDASEPEVSPLDFLAEIVLNKDPLLAPVLLPAQEALALSLGRPRLGLDEGGGGAAAAGDPMEWVQTWYYSEHRRAR